MFWKTLRTAKERDTVRIAIHQITGLISGVIRHVSTHYGPAWITMAADARLICLRREGGWTIYKFDHQGNELFNWTTDSSECEEESMFSRLMCESFPLSDTPLFMMRSVDPVNRISRRWYWTEKGLIRCHIRSGCPRNDIVLEDIALNRFFVVQYEEEKVELAEATDLPF